MSLRKIILLIMSVVMLHGCSKTTVKHVKTQFAISSDSIQIDLNKIMSSERVNVDGREITSNGQVSSELVIEIINCRNQLSNESDMRQLGKKIATIFKKSLHKKETYGVYKTVFVTKTEIAGVTKSDWTEIPFKSAEL